MKHETSEISDKETKFYLALKQAEGKWKTSSELMVGISKSRRSGRAYALKFVRLGIVDLAEVFPSHRYRLSEKANRRNASYVQRLEQAIEVFGLNGHAT